MSGPQRADAGLSATWTFFEDDWHAGDVRIMGPRTHACWLGSMVFDGARAFEGVMPDLERHCERSTIRPPRSSSSRWCRPRPGWSWRAKG